MLHATCSASKLIVQPGKGDVLWCGLLVWATFGGVNQAQEIQFNRDIRPILADKCLACHGPDNNKREAELRLDTGDGALIQRDGHVVLVPGKPDESEFVRRITTANDDERMPPASTNKSLTPQQIDLLRRWIAAGAKFEAHWSLIAPKRAEPLRAGDGWERNEIDRFVSAAHDRHGMKPSPDAHRRTLARRLSFDLLGLPPTPAEVDAFVADPSEKAYEAFVDRLLASPHFGERMATYWLDVVRYADSAGYHSDNERDVAPFRDYVIAAFNDNLPFDQFTVEQIAGDLLPTATTAQRIASGYNRLLQTTEEGGAQPKEYTAKYQADRVRNTAVAWLGLTMGCCECHSHKYDPLTQKDFYRFAAFFADVQEKAVGRQDQSPVPTPQQSAEIAQLEETLRALREEYERDTPELAAGQAKWLEQARAAIAANKSDWTVAKPEKLEATAGTILAQQDDQSVLATGPNPDKDTYVVTLAASELPTTALRLEALTHESLTNKSLSRGNGNFVLTEVEVTALAAGSVKPQPVKIKNAVASFSQPTYPIASAIDGKNNTGWATAGHEKAANHRAMFVLEKPVVGGATMFVRLKHDSTFPKHILGRFRLARSSKESPSLTDSGLPSDIEPLVAIEAAARTPDQQAALVSYYRTIAPELAPVREKIAAAEKKKLDTQAAFPKTLVSMSAEPRTVRVLPRGNWLDESGEVVQPATPEVLPAAKIDDRKLARLELARWMVRKDNPLTARVFVNRLWKLFYGQGIVKSLDDLGLQGALPTHPELLDWLAVDFMDSGWNIKRLVKQMVLSRTYQQSSHTSPQLRERDPTNQWLARASTFRLDAEFVRDNALAISGLLSRKIGGRSVHPYQPAGYWRYLNFPVREWANDRGEELYRRGLYTHWQRTFLHPSLLAFDAPSREECTVERPRSNTPLQALVLLNDPTYVEAARVFATHVLEQPGTERERLNFAFRHALNRAASDREAEVLLPILKKHHADYTREPDNATALLKIGESPLPATANPIDLAAWTSVTRTILNLHEVITRF